QIDVNRSLIISDGKLGPAAKIDGPHHASALGINHRGAVGIAIHDEDTLRERIINDAVSILVSFGFAGHFERLQIENDRLAFSTVADKALAKPAGQRYPVSLLQTSDVGDEGAAVSVNDLDFRAMGKIDAAGGRIDGDVLEVLARA